MKFDEIKQTVDKCLEDLIASNNGNELNISRPEYVHKKDKTQAKFKIEHGKYFITDLIDHISGFFGDNYSISIHKTLMGYYSFSIQNKYSALYAEEGTHNFEMTFVSNDLFSNHDSPSSELVFEDMHKYSEHDMECMLAIIRKTALTNIEKKSDPINKISELGARIYGKEEQLSFDSLVGYEDIKQQVLTAIIHPFKHPELLKRLATQTGLKSLFPKAILFEGSPGTGKTTMARIISNNIEAPMIYVPIESIMSCWYGESEKRLAEIFSEASKLGKCMLFLDEIDALASSRDRNMHEATRRLLSVLLRQIQGFVLNEDVMVIGSTNRKDDLDNALLSRFGNNIITFRLPTKTEIAGIFNHYAKHLTKEDVKELASRSDNFSGRDIEEICKDATRMYATDIIKNNSTLGLPSYDYYLVALKKREHS